MARDLPKSSERKSFTAKIRELDLKSKRENAAETKEEFAARTMAAPHAQPSRSVLAPSKEKRPREPLMRAGWVTRNGAARILGISVTELQRREKLGVVPYKIDDVKGWHLFDPAVLVDVADRPGASQRAGDYLRAEDPATKLEVAHDDAIGVFEDLVAKKKLAEIVVTRRVLPAVVRRLADEYDALENRISFSGDQVTRLRRLPFCGAVDFTSSESVVSAFERTLAPPVLDEEEKTGTRKKTG
jgi:hypothetical protein